MTTTNTRQRIPARVVECMTLLASGLDHIEVGRRMVIVPRAVTTYVYRYGRTFGCRNRREAVRHFCQANGLPVPLRYVLTPRECDVARLLADGVWQNREIARLLDIDRKRAWQHATNICRKMGARDKAALVEMLLEGGGT